MSRGISLKIVALSLAVVTGLLLVAPSNAARYRREDSVIAPGVVFSRIKDPKGPWRIRVVDIDLAQASTLETVLARDKLSGGETTSSMAQRNGAIAAINGDYARASGRPVMLFARDGELVQTALTRGVNFAVNASETTPYIRMTRRPDLWFDEADSGTAHVLDMFNAGSPRDHQIAGYSKLGGRDEKPPYWACSARLYPTAGAHPAETRIGIETPMTVNQTSCKAGRMWPKGGTVVSTPFGGSRGPEVSSLVPGEQVDLGWSLGWPEVYDTIGGNPTIVREGELFIGTGSTAFFRRHPRTGVGYTDDGRVLFVTVDGRRPKRSVGMTPREFGRLFIRLGATYALNLDGGGSTTMVVNGEVVNKPSDGDERLVSSALVLLAGPDPQPTQNPAPQPTPTPSPTLSVPVNVDDPHLLGSSMNDWEQIARDPASTGGLAEWLHSQGIRLRGSMREAFRVFSRLR